MQNSPSIAPTGKSPFSQWLSRVLPFEHDWIRYLCCAWLALSASAAAWALFVIQPATDTLISRSSYLIQLEESLLQAQSEAETYNLPALRERSEIASKRLHRDAASLDRAIVQIVEQLKEMGWKAVVANVERDNQSSDRLTYATYRLEIKSGPQPETAEDRTRPISADIITFLQTITTSEQVIAIDHLEIVSETEQTARIFATLSAAIAK